VHFTQYQGIFILKGYILKNTLVLYCILCNFDKQLLYQKSSNMKAIPIDTQSLLQNVAQMPVPELEKLVKDINALLRRKKMQDKTFRERQLLHKINRTVLNTTQTARYHVLVEKLELSTITAAEQIEFEALAHEEEKRRNQRVKYMLELAQIRAVTLPQVMASLGLIPLTHA
jgi:hypothetical protein